MLTAMATRAVQHRRLLLSAAVGLAAGLSWLQLQVAPTSVGWPALTFLPLISAFMSFGLAGGSLRKPRPTAFVVDPAVHAFRTASVAWPIYNAIGLLFLSIGQIGKAVDDIERATAFGYPELRVMSIFTAAMIGLAAVVTAWLVTAVWRGTLGVQLRPEGIADRGPFGTLNVPWEALAAGYPQLRSPSAGSLVLTYTRPDLVRRHGLTARRRISAYAVDPRFLGTTIAYYVAYPQCRSDIGTQAGYDRLRWALTGQPPSGLHG